MTVHVKKSNFLPLLERDSAGLLAALEFWSQQCGSSVAQVFANQSCSYSGLAERVRRCSAVLASLGVGPGVRVAIGVSRSDMLLPLLLAVWSRRAAYVPVDPDYPLSRQSYILQNSEAQVLVCDRENPDLEFNGQVLLLETLRSSQPDTPSLLIAPTDYHPDDLAYMIFTSGSTGNPKGVAVTQGNLNNFLLAMAERPGLQAGDCLLAVTTISFDIHVLELFLPLLVGAQVVIAAREDAISHAVLQQLINQYQVSAMQATPATWRMLLDGGWKPAQPLKILVGGEALPRDLLPLMQQAGSELWNMYGPTETTVWSTCHRILPSDEKIYIGTPIRQTTVHIVDEELKPVPNGMPGELLIGGAGVTRGYHNNQELTDQKFLTLSHLEGGRVYRTGDLVIRHPDGLLEYVNRIDNQIKIRGYRIEPGEIETALEEYPGVKQAVVVAVTKSEGDVRVLAYYLGEPVPAETLRAFAQSVLPAHMVPQHFSHLAEFPMTANYKVDRKQLAAQGQQWLSNQNRSADAVARDDLDLSLIAVWEKVLGIKGIGLDDNFFAMGGHSLLALKLVEEMRKVSGLELASTALFEHYTIRTLREHAGQESKQAASVVKLNKISELDRDPVFCLCGVQIYQAFADKFEGARPVYGIFAQMELAFIAQEQQHEPQDYSIDLLVDTYVEAIRRQGDFTRVSLVGLSFGGLIALEVAQRLAREGVQVTSVTLLDSYMSHSSRRTLPALFRDACSLVRRRGLRALAQQLVGKSRRRRITADRAPAERRAWEMNCAESARSRAFDRAARAYAQIKKSYDFDVLLIKASQTNFGFGMRGTFDYGFSSFVRGKLTVKTVPADHIGLMTGPPVIAVHRLISEYEASLN